MCLAVKLVGKPGAGNRHARFDERGWETGRWLLAPSYRAHPRLYQQLAQTPSPSTGSRQETHNVGSAMSSASLAACDHASRHALSALCRCEEMERGEEGSTSMGGRLSPGLPTLKRQESPQHGGRRPAASLLMRLSATS